MGIIQKMRDCFSAYRRSGRPVYLDSLYFGSYCSKPQKARTRGTKVIGKDILFHRNSL